MLIEWDKSKASQNETKHGIRFSDVEPVFYDPEAITVEDMATPEEERFITFGSDMFGRVLAVVFTWRGDVVRIISARKATNRERRDYEN